VRATPRWGSRHARPVGNESIRARFVNP
jgi:hypothetical protein